MTKTQYLESLSPEGTLTIGFAFGDILAFYAIPSAAVVGATIDTNTLVKNTGDTPARFHLTYIRWDTVIGGTYTILKDSSEFTLEGGAGHDQEWIYTPAIDTMPSRDVIYRAIVWRDGTADDTQDAVVELLTQVGTTLTNTIAPINVYKGGKYRYFGKLTRNDSSVGIASALIYLQRLEGGVWTNVGTTPTNASGEYASADIIAPSPATTPATFQVRAHYLGSAILGLGESFSPVSTVGFVLPAGVENVAVIGGLGLALGIVGYAMSKRNKARKATYLSIAGLAIGAGIQKARGRI